MAKTKSSSKKIKRIFNVKTGPWILVAAVAISFIVLYSYSKTNTPSSSAFTLPPAGQQRLYIATNGNDISGDGSVLKPLRSISKAIALSLAGKVAYLHPIGNLELAPNDLDGLRVYSGQNIQLTKSPLTIAISSPVGTPVPLHITVGASQLTVSNLEWRSTGIWVEPSTNGKATVTGNRFVKDARANSSPAGKIMVKSATSTSAAQVTNNTFVFSGLHNLGVDIMQSKAGQVTVAQNNFTYPSPLNRISPDLKYTGINIWRYAADSGKGIRIFDNNFVTTDYLSLNLSSPNDVGINLSGAKSVEIGDNDFTRFRGKSIQP